MGNENVHRTLPYIPRNARWAQNGQIIAGGCGSGSTLNQLKYPCGLYVNDDQTILIADRDNYRIVEWKCGAENGQVVAGGNGRGKQTDQLNCPTVVINDKETDYLIICDRDNRRVTRWSRRSGMPAETLIEDIDCVGLAMDDQRFLYVSDNKKHEVRRYRVGETNGTVVAGGHGEGDRLDQLDSPGGLFVDRNYSVYVSDWKNHRVMKWVKDAKEGIIVAGGRGQGNDWTQLSSPEGLFVDSLGTIYVADYNNNRVMSWCNGATHGTVIVGGNGSGNQANKLNGPACVSFDRQGNLYVVDNNNHRVQRFSIEAS
ncbi:unnamed protein product [Rotaria sp. Silwood1]|nr:unnamed protein product [Rotaria sp. Silwood1]